MSTRTAGISVSARELDFLRRLDADQSTPLPVDVAADLERKGLVLSGWGGLHVLTPEGKAALRGLGGLIKPA